MGTIEGLWDCPICGRKRIGGLTRDCPSCGRPRGEGVEFYLPGEGSRRYLSAAENSKRTGKPDWYCRHCESLNSDAQDYCESCGAPKTDETYFDVLNSKSAKPEPSRPFGSDPDRESPTSSSRYPSYSPHVSNNSGLLKKILGISGIVAVAAALVVGLIFLLIPKEKELTIMQKSWERCIFVEMYKTVDENSWTLPSDARDVSTRQEIHHYVQVLDHYETRMVTKSRISGYRDIIGYRNNGDGTFDEYVAGQEPIYEYYQEAEQVPVYRDVPIYQTKYYYKVDRWRSERKVETNGTNSDPQWGEPNLTKKEEGKVSLGDERISSRSQEYKIIGLDNSGKKEKEYKLSLPYEQWNSLKVDQKAKFKISIGGKAEIIEE